MTNRDLIITELRKRANLDDDELAKRIGKNRHMVNQECRLLAQRGVIIREPGGSRGKLVNRLIDSGVKSVSSPRTSTKADVAGLHGKIDSTAAGLRTEMIQMRAELKTDIERLNGKIDSRFTSIMTLLGLVAAAIVGQYVMAFMG